MLGLLCPECSIVKISPPALGPRVCIRRLFVYFAKQLQLLGIFAARKMFWVDIVSFSLVNKLILLSCDAYVCIAYIDVPKVHWQPFTVENLPWTKRDILLGPCLDNMTAG